MDTRVETAIDTNGNTVELATIIHEGHEYTALGAILDPEHPGVYCRYETGELITWSGDVVGRFEITNTYRHNFGGRMDCIDATLTFDSRRYYGRKSHDWSDFVWLRPHKNQ